MPLQEALVLVCICMCAHIWRHNKHTRVNTRATFGLIPNPNPHRPPYVVLALIRRGARPQEKQRARCVIISRGAGAATCLHLIRDIYYVCIVYSAARRAAQLHYIIRHLFSIRPHNNNKFIEIRDLCWRLGGAHDGVASYMVYCMYIMYMYI